MIWLIGNRGMLGTDIENGLIDNYIDFIATDKEIDIADDDALRKYIKDYYIDWIINCSAYTAVDKAEDERDLAFKVNAEGVLNIARIAKEKNASLIHISTDYVFSGEKDGEYKEKDAAGPKSVYGLSKLQGEKNVMDMLDRYYIFRVSWLFGVHGNNFVYTMLRLFKERDELKVVSDQYGSPTYSRDLADLIISIVKNNVKNFGLYHFTNEGRTNWHEFAAAIYSRAKKNRLTEREVAILPITTAEYPTRAERPKNSYLSKDKVKKKLGIKIRSWQDALDDFFKKMRNNR
ncbi:MAG: dTDP-4-dehydrorhamnose reductase [Spirochaetes bacterium]|jgi:dTDP-4-dehydrorhamnose reductase|nr:dTDP-4-dehydrorhamnose reductase [Spirochaetota bacterium]